jgi:hypothetical protein
MQEPHPTATPIVECQAFVERRRVVQRTATNVNGLYIISARNTNVKD